jgi:osmoprotectant transport system substrate-binding protein
MRNPRIGVAGAMLAVFVLFLGACGDSGDDTDTTDEGGDAAGADEGTCASFSGDSELTVGGTNFSEQEIVAEIYAQCLEAAGFEIEKKLKIGSREIVLPALENGDIDLYPEYVGTLLTFLDGEPTPGDVDKTVADLQTVLEGRKLTLLEPAPAEDKNGFAMTKAKATQLKVTKLSDLAGKSKDLVFGAGPECEERPLCLIGLKETYGLEFKEVRKLDSGGPLTKDALEKGDIDVGLIFTSDGAVAARGFVVLEDDKGLQPPENLIPIVRDEVLEGDLEELLNSISEKLTTEGLSELNKQVDVDKADPADVAEEWLIENGFLAES